MGKKAHLLKWHNKDTFSYPNDDKTYHIPWLAKLFKCKITDFDWPVVMGDVYVCLSTQAFTMPRVFDDKGGEDARHAHLYPQTDPEHRTSAIARTVRKVTHAAVPPEWTETAINVLHSGFAFGPNKRGVSGRCRCSCGAGDATVEHLFYKCVRSRRLLEMLLQQWREVTGEHKLKGDNQILAMFGDRSTTWLLAEEEAEWAGLEEPFALMHKAFLHTVRVEYETETARRGRRRRRSAAELYQKVSSRVERVMEDRWKSARARRREDGGRAIAAFRRMWVAPGIARMSADGTSTILLLFLSARTRDKWATQGDSLRSRHQRNVAYAPPKQLPYDVVSVFTDGSAIPRKRGQLFPPAGYGVVAVEGGQGHEHRGGRELHVQCAPLTQSTPNLETGTNNSAELLGFTRALQWAARHPAARGRPVCMRYDSVYAAMIASGTWKPKCHRALAAEAREAWDDLYKITSARLWMRHVRGHSKHEWNDRVDKLAKDGMRGRTRYYVNPVMVD